MLVASDVNGNILISGIDGDDRKGELFAPDCSRVLPSGKTEKYVGAVLLSRVVARVLLLLAEGKRVYVTSEVVAGEIATLAGYVRVAGDLAEVVVEHTKRIGGKYEDTAE